MKNIRKAVFETNSSSSHSIHIDNVTPLLDTSLLPDGNGDVILTGGEFGWNWSRFNDAVTKANYCAIPDSGVNFEHLQEAIIEQTGAKTVTYTGQDNYDSPSGVWSYIDHESIGVAGELSDIEKVRNFVFNPNCWLVTGNDNSSHPNNLFDFPKVNNDGEVIEVLYRYRLEVEGITESPMFASRPNKSEVEDAIRRMTQEAKFYKSTAMVRVEALYQQIYGRNFNVFQAKGYQVLESSMWHDGSEECFEADAYQFRDGYDASPVYVNMREKFFYVYSSNLLNQDMNDLIPRSTNMDWEDRQAIQKKLIKENFSDYTIKIPFKIVKI